MSGFQVLGRPLQVSLRPFTFSWNCTSPATLQCRRAVLHPFVHKDSQGDFCSDLTLDLYYNINVTSLVRSNHSCQICSIKENQPPNISLGSQIISIISICLATNRPARRLLIVLISQSSSANLKCSLCLILFCSFLGRGDRWWDIFFSFNFFLREFLGRRSDHTV